jgi:hypothetical protein
MKVLLKADGHTTSGGTPLIMHSERLADPLDSCTQSIAGVSKKKNKTLADHEEIARREFLGGLYTTPSIELTDKGQMTHNSQKVCVPAWNVLRCLQDGATRQKRGRDVLRGIQPLVVNADLTYDGPEAPEDLWKAGTFALRKTVGVQRSRTVRTRPMFDGWQLELPIEVDATVFDVHTLRVAWADAGKYAGLGDMRPVYGRFVGTIDVLENDENGGGKK